MVQKILVLDDEENYAEMLKALLLKHRFAVDSATKPELALEALHDVGYDLVVSDFKMPVMDGADFLQKARALNPELPVILVSGLMNTPELVKVANMGVTLVLEKPIDVNDFIANVTRFVQPLSDKAFSEYQASGGTQAPFELIAHEVPVELSYPRPARHFSDLCQGSQHFLQQIWNVFETDGDCCIGLPIGSDWDLVLRELSGWIEQPTGKVHRLDAVSVGTGRFREDLKAIIEDPASSQLVGIGNFSDLPDNQLARLATFVKDPVAIVPEAEQVRFIFFVEDELFAKDSRLTANRELFDMLSNGVATLPPLRQRVADLAVYAQRYLQLFAEVEGQPERGQLSADATGFLLQYEWPGNFYQLIDVLRRALQVRTDGPVERDAIVRILEEDGADAADAFSPDLMPLNARLKAIQHRLVKEALPVIENDYSRLLDALQVSDPDERAARGADADELLFPDLIHFQNGSAAP